MMVKPVGRIIICKLKNLVVKLYLLISFVLPFFGLMWPDKSACFKDVFSSSNWTAMVSKPSSLDLSANVLLPPGLKGAY